MSKKTYTIKEFFEMIDEKAWKTGNHPFHVRCEKCGKEDILYTSNDHKFWVCTCLKRNKI